MCAVMINGSGELKLVKLPMNATAKTANAR
jgi:hypothetical protein